jgi:mono/diheme cytochrome c family protein
MRWQIALGTVAFGVLVIALVFIAAGEQDRMESFTASYASRRIEAGALLYENNCRSCHGPQGEGIPGVAPAINSADLYTGERMEAIGFSGTVEDYLRGVIAAGRPVPSEGANYPQRMPTWAQEFGGPLRKDQIDSLVAFIMNWEDRALAAAEPEDAMSPEDTVGLDIRAVLPVGDEESGKMLVESAEFGCTACHMISTVGPGWEAEGDLPGIGPRAALRIAADDYTGEAETPEQYLLESIVHTYAYVVEGYNPALMPGDYGDRMNAQQAADILAYMQSIK